MALDAKDAAEFAKLAKTKPKLLIFGKKASDFKRPAMAALPADRLGGKSGKEIAKLIGMSAIRPGQELHVAQIKFPTREETYLGVTKLGSLRAQIFKKGVGFKPLGFLQCEEKFRKDYLRKKLGDPVLWSVNDARGVEYDAAKMHSLAVHGAIESWAASGVKLARVIPASNTGADGSKGFFTHLKCIKGKTPKQMEKILGFKAGYYKDGVHVFTASPSQLSVSKVIM